MLEVFEYVPYTNRFMVRYKYKESIFGINSKVLMNVINIGLMNALKTISMSIRPKCYALWSSIIVCSIMKG